MKIGFDTYTSTGGSETFGSASRPSRRFPRGTLDLVDVAHRLGAEMMSLQTCFLPPPQT